MKIFDAHFHIINPNFPLVKNNGYLPPNFTIEDYQEKVEGLGIIGGAIVSGSFQKFDQSYLLDALNKLGNNYFGVANIPLTMKTKELEKLNQSNICAVRFNLKRGGSESIKNMVRLSNKLYDNYGWHTELYVDSKNLKELKTTLEQLPRFSIDHFGLSQQGLKDLYYWVEKDVKIKATGFGRIDFEPIYVMKKINELNPKALMFGTDLPSTRAKTSFSNLDIQKIKDNFSEKDQERFFYRNAIAWYKK